MMSIASLVSWAGRRLPAVTRMPFNSVMGVRNTLTVRCRRKSDRAVNIGQGRCGPDEPRWVTRASRRSRPGALRPSGLRVELVRLRPYFQVRFDHEHEASFSTAELPFMPAPQYVRAVSPLSHDLRRPRSEADGFWRRKRWQASDGQSGRSFRRSGAPLAAKPAHDVRNRPVLFSDRASQISLWQAGARSRLSVTGCLQGLDRRWSGITPSRGARPSRSARNMAWPGTS